jgi:hypothetical protein
VKTNFIIKMADGTVVTKSSLDEVTIGWNTHELCSGSMIQREGSSEWLELGHFLETATMTNQAGRIGVTQIRII